MGSQSVVFAAAVLVLVALVAPALGGAEFGCGGARPGKGPGERACKLPKKPAGDGGMQGLRGRAAEADDRIVLDEPDSSDEESDLDTDTESEEEPFQELQEQDLEDLRTKWDKWARASSNGVYSHRYGDKHETFDWENPYRKKEGKVWRSTQFNKSLLFLLEQDDINLSPSAASPTVLKQREFFEKISKYFSSRHEGEPATFLVGGYVRDLVAAYLRDEELEQSVKDVDVAVMANPEIYEQVCDHFNWKCSLKRYPWNNIMKWGNALPGYGNKDVTAIETLPAKINVQASNHWRDYTVNSLYFDMKEGVILDPTGYGLSDLKDDLKGRKILRIADYMDKDSGMSYNAFFERNWFRTGTGPAKVARWFHMLLKGYVGEYNSENYIRSKVCSITDGTDESSDLVDGITRYWRRQTLNNEETRLEKAKKIDGYIYDLTRSCPLHNKGAYFKWHGELEDIVGRTYPTATGY